MIPFSIRRGTKDDQAWLIEQLLFFEAVYGVKTRLLGPQLGSHVGSLIDHHLVLIAENETPLGFVAGSYYPSPANFSTQILSEKYWWVKPAARGNGVGRALLNAFLDWGKQNSDIVTCGLAHHSQASEPLLTACGFRLQEITYLLETKRKGA